MTSWILAGLGYLLSLIFFLIWKVSKVRLDTERKNVVQLKKDNETLHLEILSFEAQLERQKALYEELRRKDEEEQSTVDDIDSGGINNTLDFMRDD